MRESEGGNRVIVGLPRCQLTTYLTALTAPTLHTSYAVASRTLIRFTDINTFCM